MANGVDRVGVANGVDRVGCVWLWRPWRHALRRTWRKQHNALERTIMFARLRLKEKDVLLFVGMCLVLGLLCGPAISFAVMFMVLFFPALGRLCGAVGVPTYWRRMTQAERNIGHKNDRAALPWSVLHLGMAVLTFWLFARLVALLGPEASQSFIQWGGLLGCDATRH